MAIQNRETPIHDIAVDGTNPDAWQQLGLTSADIGHRAQSNTQQEQTIPNEGFLPRVSEHLLGQAAVMTHVSMTEYAIGGDSVGENAERSKLENAIKQAREYLGRLDPSLNKKIVTKLFTEFEMPTFLKDLTGGRDLTPGNRLVFLNSQDDKGVPRVADETLLNLFEWRANQVTKKQAKFEQETVAPMRQRYLQRFQEAIDKGWLPQDALTEERQQYIRTTPVLMDDGLGLDSQFDSLFGGATAYAQAQTENPYIVVRENADQQNAKNIEATFTHEMTHVLTGRSTPRGPFMHSDEDYNPATTYGVERLFEFSTMMARSLNEATTEHFKLALLGGNIDRVRVFQSETYQTERYILKSVCEMAGISPRLFVQAMFEGDTHQSERYWPSVWDDETTPSASEDANPSISQLRVSLEKAFPDQDIIGVLSAMKLDPTTFSSFNLPRAYKEVRKLKKVSARTKG